MTEISPSAENSSTIVAEAVEDPVAGGRGSSVTVSKFLPAAAASSAPSAISQNAPSAEPQ